MKFSLLTGATLLLPLSILAHPSLNPNPLTVLRKCFPLLGDIGENEAWFIANLQCNYVVSTYLSCITKIFYIATVLEIDLSSVRKMDSMGVDVIGLRSKCPP
jgi:hypothetical protein